MKVTHKTIIKALAYTALLSAGQVQAAMVQFSLNGGITSASNPNIFDLATSDIITASGEFDDSVIGSGLAIIDFSFAYNNMQFSIGNTVYTDSMDAVNGAYMYFIDGVFDGIDYDAIDGSYDSWGTIGGTPGLEDFTGSGIAGNWDTNTFQTTSAVPVPAAVWLFGSGLTMLAGFSRRKGCRS